jgi:signal transduction histidine kinase
MVSTDEKWAVLLVDDEEDIRDVLKVSLEDMGYVIVMASNGEEALEQFSDLRPPIVMTDIKMPGMDGIKLLQEIKRIDPETEVIMITGHGDMKLAIESLKNEASDFITKPINVDALEIALNRVCEKIVVRRKLKEYTENLERLIYDKSQLQDHLSSLGLMIGSISHDIKGLLTGLDGGLYLVESGLSKEDGSKIQEGWEIVKQMIERIRKLVFDILFYTKERKLDLHPIQPSEFIDNLAVTLENKMHRHQIHLVRDVDPSAGEFMGDADLLNSAMINIIENAIDACRKDKTKPDHHITLEAKQKNKRMVFEITDNGIGMDEASMKKIFNLFFSTKGSKGTGFGLYIANHIIQLHGGRIDVNSKPHEGTSFIVTLPREPKT